MREITLPAEYEVGQGYGKVAWDVRAIWENYSGWFHHRSTTELYPVGFDAVSADVVELAGADALVDRAREHLGADRPLHAIHLAELVPAGPSRGARGAERSPRKALGRHHELLGKSLAHRTNREILMTAQSQFRFHRHRGADHRRHQRDRACDRRAVSRRRGAGHHHRDQTGRNGLRRRSVRHGLPPVADDRPRLGGCIGAELHPARRAGQQRRREFPWRP